MIVCLSSVVFNRHHTDLIGLGKDSLTENIAISTEKFICKIYGVPEVDTCNKARVKLYCIGRTQETLPTTSDAAKFHIMRSHYQASVWNQAHSPYADLPPVTEMGWMHLDGRLVPRLLSLPPIPKACREITSCGCTIIRRGASANAAAAGKFLWNAQRRATAGNLATHDVTLMRTGNKFM